MLQPRLSRLGVRVALRGRELEPGVKVCTPSHQYPIGFQEKRGRTRNCTLRVGKSALLACRRAPPVGLARCRVERDRRGAVRIGECPAGGRDQSQRSVLSKYVASFCFPVGREKQAKAYCVDLPVRLTRSRAALRLQTIFLAVPCASTGPLHCTGAPVVST